VEVKLLLDGPSNQLLKLISNEDFSDVLPGLIKYLKPGVLLEGKVLKSFPEKNKAIVQLDKKQVVVETRQSLTPGQSFSARVEKTFPQPILKIITQSTKLDIDSSQLKDKIPTPYKKYSDITNLKTRYMEPVPQQLTSSDIKSLNLRPGQSVGGKVVHIISKNKAILTILDKEVTVHFKTVKPPKPETLVKLMVKPYKNNYILVSRDESVLTGLVNIKQVKSLLSSKEPFGDMVQKIESLVKSSVLPKNIIAETEIIGRLIRTLNLLKSQTNIIPDGIKLREQVEFSGINYESKVKQKFEDEIPFQPSPNLNRDLKGQLLELVNVIEDSDKTREFSRDQTGYFNKTIQTLRRAIDNIELQQLTNQISRQENQPIAFQIPNPFTGDKKSITLYLRQVGDESCDKKNAQKKGVLLVFLLELSSLGNLRVDARFNKEIVAVKIGAENERVAQFINANIKEFNSRLIDLGFQSEVTCCVMKENEHYFENKLSQLVIDECEQLVDLKT